MIQQLSWQADHAPRAADSGRLGVETPFLDVVALKGSDGAPKTSQESLR